MRCILKKYNENMMVSKSVFADASVYSQIAEKFITYSDWLKSGNINIPKTSIEYKNSHIIFKQNFIKANSHYNIKSIVDSLKLLDYTLYGIDASPGNFIFYLGKLYYVDFYPFLMNSKTLLEKQFDYSYKLIIQRYFNQVNILATFINRLFKLSLKDGKEALAMVSADFLLNYQAILPREKVRLLFALNNLHKEFFHFEYETFYVKTKNNNFISFIKNEELKDLLKNIQHEIKS